MPELTETLDPVGSMTDLATLMARLADPFVRPAGVLAKARVAKGALEAAKVKWAEAFKGNPMLARLYGELFQRERARLRGEPEVAQGKVDAAPRALPVAAPAPSPSMDETALAPLIAETRSALPFTKGTFEPDPQPVAAARERGFDPDATRLPAAGDGDTLPFVRLLPSQTLKKP